MPMPSAWNTNLPDEVLYGPAVLDYDLGAGTRAVLGMSRGSHQFVPGEERKGVEADGIKQNILGLRRVLRWVDTRFEGTLVQLPFAQIAKFLPGSTSVAAGTPAVTTITPAPGAHVFAAADYYLKPRLNWVFGNGDWLFVEFPYGELAEFPTLSAPDRDEGTIPYRLLAIADPAAVGWTPNTPPFKIVHNAAA